MWMDFPFQNISDNEFRNMFQTARCDKSLCQELNILKCDTSENRNFEDECLPKKDSPFSECKYHNIESLAKLSKVKSA